MPERATQTTVIEAPVEKIFGVLLDFDRYPEFFEAVKEVTVHERDEEGRPADVSFRTAAMGRSTRYRLRYDYSQAPNVMSWTLVEGDIMRQLDGHYRLTPLADDPSRTEVEYQLTVDLVIPLPGFVKRRAESMIMKAALPELKQRVESLAD